MKRWKLVSVMLVALVAAMGVLCWRYGLPWQKQPAVVPTSSTAEQALKTRAMLLQETAGQRKPPPPAKSEIGRLSARSKDAVLNGPYGRMPVEELLSLALHTRDTRRRDMFLALLVRKEEAVPALATRLGNGTDDERYDTLMLIQGHLRWRETAPAVRVLLGDTDASEVVRGRAATACSLFGLREVIPAVEDLLTSASSRRARGMAAMALGYLQADSAIGALKKALEDPSETVRLRAAGSLGMLGSGAGLDVAIALSRHEHFGRRSVAAETLSQIRTTAAVTRLQEMATEDKSPTVRSEAAERLQIIELERLEPREAINRCKQLLAAGNPNPPRWAFQYMVDHFGPEAKDFLEDLAARPGPMQEPACRALIYIESGVVRIPLTGRSTR